MWETVVGWGKALGGWIKGLLGGKGTGQYGNRNQAVSGTTAGDNSPAFAAGRDMYLMPPLAGTPPAQEAEAPAPGEKARALLLGATSPGADGTVMWVYNSEVKGAMADGKYLMKSTDQEPKDHETVSLWREAVDELAGRGFISDGGAGTGHYEVTAAGWRAARELRADG